MLLVVKLWQLELRSTSRCAPDAAAVGLGRSRVVSRPAVRGANSCLFSKFMLRKIKCVVVGIYTQKKLISNRTAAEEA